MRSIALVLAVAVGSAVAVSPLAARAQAPDDAKQFADAQAKFDRGEHEPALATFRALYDRTKSPNARLYVARSLAKLGRVVEAYDEMAATLREATRRAAAEARYEDTRAATAAELALLEQRVGKLTVALADEQGGGKVFLDDVELGEAKLGVSLTVAPGAHVVRFERAGAATVVRNVVLEGGQTRTVALAAGAGTAPAGPAGPAPAPAPAPGAGDAKPAASTRSAKPEPAPDAGSGGLGAVRIAGIGVAVLGVAGFVTSAVFYAKGGSLYEELEAERDSAPCKASGCTNTESFADRQDTGRGYDTLATVGLAVGLVGVAAGGVMIALGGPKASAAKAGALRPGPRASFGPAFGPRGGSLRIRVAF